MRDLTLEPCRNAETDTTAGGGRGVDGPQGPGAPPQGEGLGGGITRRIGKRMKPTDLKAEDRKKINDPPCESVLLPLSTCT